MRITMLSAARHAAKLTVCSLVFFTFSGATRGQVVLVDSLGFEPPLNNNLPLEGQATGSSLWQRVAPLGASLATSGTVQSAVVESGSQAVQVTRAANGDSDWHVADSDQPHLVDITWDMRVEQSTSAAASGPFFGAEADNNHGSDDEVFGALGVDAKTGDVLYRAPGPATFTPTGVVAAFGVWNTFGMELNFAEQEYTLFFNGANLGAFSFVDSAHPPGAVFLPAFVTLATADDATSQAAIGTAYFDNYLVVETVPEPSSALIASVAALGIALCRRGRRERQA
jgi:hypothetical protein